MPRHTGSLSSSRHALGDTIQLRPVPLQEVAEGPTCVAAAPIEEPEVVDHDGISDDEQEETPEYMYYERPVVALMAGSQGRAISAPLDSQEPSTVGPSAPWRYEPYSWSVLHPEHRADFRAPVPLPAAIDEEPFAYEEDWDAPQHAAESYFPVEHESDHYDAYVPVATTSQPSEQRDTTSTVMCCYFKQKGFCKMGADCWYAHNGDENTPCHYGATCKAGHSHLTKTAGHVPPRRQTRPTRPATQPTVRRAPAPARPSAAMIQSNIPCAFCGDSQGVLLQEIPVYEGNTRLRAHRAHCLSCLRTYALE